MLAHFDNLENYDVLEKTGKFGEMREVFQSRDFKIVPGILGRSGKWGENVSDYKKNYTTGMGIVVLTT